MSGDESGVTSGNQITLESNDAQKVETQNEANAESTFNASNSSKASTSFADYPKTLNEGKQGKHIPGHNNYQSGKSRLTISMQEAARLVKDYSGKGTPISKSKERVNFGKTIGYYVDPTTGKKKQTKIGIIHYSKTGAHIVPARPKEK